MISIFLNVFYSFFLYIKIKSYQILFLFKFLLILKKLNLILNQPLLILLFFYSILLLKKNNIICYIFFI